MCRLAALWNEDAVLQHSIGMEARLEKSALDIDSRFFDPFPVPYSLAALFEIPGHSADWAFPRVVSKQWIDPLLKKSRACKSAQMPAPAMGTGQTGTAGFESGLSSCGHRDPHMSYRNSTGILPHSVVQESLFLSGNYRGIEACNPFPRKVSHRLRQGQRVVERLRPFQTYSQLARVLAKQNVHVEQDLDVIA